MSAAIAIVGQACRYADASSPDELWENVLAGRRAFRRIPTERLRVEDYYSCERSAPDSIYSVEAAVIQGFDFDRVKFKISGDTFRATDLAHWLALDTAAKALEDSNILDDLPRETTGVFLGNTLAGEFSRANTLRLRFPFVSRVLEASLQREIGCGEKIAAILDDFERRFKAPFPAISEDSLAGGLSNTIAGRICNHFDLKGGGYTIDGACSSSLLAIANACSVLQTGDLDIALAGGVDTSLDPFELVGFAKLGAIAQDEMRVFDANSDGFLPGEGCGFVVLMREEEAIRQGRRIYAVIKGWGISSDGKGGITRPEVAGQLLAIQRAYRRAGFTIGTVPYFEGHGTGTLVGDATELKTLSSARRETGPTPKAVISSVKTLIGHTKAAAGVAGLLKAVMALKTEILPATTGCNILHQELSDPDGVLKVLHEAEPWPENEPLRAGVSSMGFGGINAHVVLERTRSMDKQSFSFPTILTSSSQDCELFLLSSDTASGLAEKISALSRYAERLSYAELGDLSTALANVLENRAHRAAIIASSPKELSEKLQLFLNARREEPFGFGEGVYSGIHTRQPRIGFLFSGQGSPVNIGGGHWRRRFPITADYYQLTNDLTGAEVIQTHIAQPAIVSNSIAALHVLKQFNVEGQIGVGHSLGEITALHWAGAYDEGDLLQLATVRGKAMGETNRSGTGAMLVVAQGEQEIKSILNGENVAIAAMNSRNKTVLSGDVATIDKVQRTFRSNGIPTSRLAVSHAFHSQMVSGSASFLAAYLSNKKVKPLVKRVVSTIIGNELSSHHDLQELLVSQITSPVRFFEAIERAEQAGVDLWIEVGPGSILSNLIKEITRTPALSVNAGSESLRGLFEAVGGSFVLGCPIHPKGLSYQRMSRPFNLDWNEQFFASPCELAPLPSEYSNFPSEIGLGSTNEFPVEKQNTRTGNSATDTLIEFIAQHAELPLSSITPESRMLSDLHLNSITVSQIVTNAAKAVGAARPSSPLDFADATVAEISETLKKLTGNDISSPTANELPVGIEVWVRPFRLELMERQLASQKTEEISGVWEVFANHNDLLSEKLKGQLSRIPGAGVIAILSSEPSENQIPLMLESAKRLLERAEGKYVLIQHSKWAGAFARTFSLEHPNIQTIVINVPAGNDNVTEWILREISGSTESFLEAHYDSNGNRFEPVLRSYDWQPGTEDILLSERDVLLVTGGAKGITAECVLALAKKTGVRLALLGRSDPNDDKYLSEQLERFHSYGITFRYYSVDVTDLRAVGATLAKVESELDAITAVLHAAGTNEPCLISNLHEEQFQRTLAAKVTGAKNLIACLNPASLKLFVAFGSIIARSGLPGESDYGVANEWLTFITERFQLENPSCRCLAIEWSVWAEVGMGAKVGNLESLRRQGIQPIPVEVGVRLFLQVLAQGNVPCSILFTGRFPEYPTLKVYRPELPFLRYLERPLVFYPNIELICDVQLSIFKDLYLEDHQLQGQRILPAVIAMEAMAQIAIALVNGPAITHFEGLEFKRSVVITEKTHDLRLVALARDHESVEVAIRSSATNFSIDHFNGVLRFGYKEAFPRVDLDANVEVPIDIDPARDLYGKLLFHQGRYRRLRSYSLLIAKECWAWIEPDEITPWFNQFLPSQFLIGDPAVRDAAIHAIQACIPHATLLPISVDKVSINRVVALEPALVHAVERSRNGDKFVFDVDLMDRKGDVYESWKGLHLKTMGVPEAPKEWRLPLLNVYLERHFERLIRDPGFSFALVSEGETEGRSRSNRAIRFARSEDTKIIRRSDGKPETLDGAFVSASHSGDFTFAVASDKPLSCDIETIKERAEEDWMNLLGEADYQLAQNLSNATADDSHTSGTRVWSARECLKKASAPAHFNISIEDINKTGWVYFWAGEFSVSTLAVQLEGVRFVLAVLVRKNGKNI